MKNTLNFTDEFNHLMTLLENTWNIPNFNAFKESVAKPVFNKGLANGRIWIDPFLTFRIGREINGDPSELSPVSHRSKLHKIDGNYDSLHLLTNQINSALCELAKSSKSFQKATVSAKVKSLVKKYHHYPVMGMGARSFSKSAQMEFINTYPGFPAGNRSISTPEKLAFSEVEFCLVELDREPFHLLVNAIYSHGLACAQERNEQELIALLKPIYVEHFDSPFNVFLHDSFMPTLLQHELFALLNAAAPFKFYTVDEYAEAALFAAVQKGHQNASMMLSSLTLENLSGEEAALKLLGIHKERTAYLDEVHREIDGQLALHSASLNPDFKKSPLSMALKAGGGSLLVDTVFSAKINSKVAEIAHDLQGKPTDELDVDARIKHHIENLSVYCI